MSRRGYTYAPRGSRRLTGGWWLAVPTLLVLGAVLLSTRLADAGPGLFTASVEHCPGAAGCPLAVSSEPVCTPQDPCVAAQGGAPSVTEGQPGPLSGIAAAVLEEPCGASLYQYNAHQRLAPASLAKIVTALVAVDSASLDDTVEVSISGPELAAETGSTIMGIEPGERLTLRDLLYGLLLPSGNDAAIAIAEHVGGSSAAFAAKMNDEVTSLGLEDSHFTNPHGLDDPQLYTSAFDIATLGAELLRRPELAEIVGTLVHQPDWDGDSVWNGNRLLQDYPGAIGVKIGYTDEAAQTIVGAAERDGRTVVVSVLGSAAVYQDAINLLDWAFQSSAPACPR